MVISGVPGETSPGGSAPALAGVPRWRGFLQQYEVRTYSWTAGNGCQMRVGCVNARPLPLLVGARNRNGAIWLSVQRNARAFPAHEPSRASTEEKEGEAKLVCGLAVPAVCADVQERTDDGAALWSE